MKLTSRKDPSTDIVALTITGASGTACTNSGCMCTGVNTDSLTTRLRPSLEENMEYEMCRIGQNFLHISLITTLLYAKLLPYLLPNIHV